MKRLLLPLFCLACACLPTSVSAQTTTDAAKADGKAFGRDQAAAAQSAATTDPDANRIPNFGGVPNQSGYFDDPDRMAREAASQATANTGYRTMRDSMDRRAQFAPQDLDAVVARSNVINDDPLSYTSGMSISGSQGRCVPLPPGTGTAARYMATCNVGYTATQETRSCPVTLNATIEQRQVYGYYCVGGSGVEDQRRGRGNVLKRGRRLKGLTEIERPGFRLFGQGKAGGFLQEIALGLCGLQLAPELPHQRRGGILACLAAQFCGPARIFDHRPGDRIVVQSPGLIDMGRKDDPERTLGCAGLIAGCDGNRGTQTVMDRSARGQILGRARIDHLAGCAVALRGTAGEIAFDIRAEGGAAAGQHGKAGRGENTVGKSHDDYPFLAGARAAAFAGLRNSRSTEAGRYPSRIAPSDGRTITGVPLKPWALAKASLASSPLVSHGFGLARARPE